MITLEEPKLRARDRQSIGVVLNSIQKSNSEKLLLPEEVVREAEKPDSPLHPHFDWDDSAAAEKWRLAQARCLIRSIKCVNPDDPNEDLVPRYVSLLPDRHRHGGGYREAGQVLSSRKLMAELEATAKGELEAWTARYKMLKGLCDRVRRAAGLKTGG